MITVSIVFNIISVLCVVSVKFISLWKYKKEEWSESIAFFLDILPGDVYTHW